MGEEGGVMGMEEEGGKGFENAGFRLWGTGIEGL